MSLNSASSSGAISNVMVMQNGAAVTAFEVAMKDMSLFNEIRGRSYDGRQHVVHESPIETCHACGCDAGSAGDAPRSGVPGKAHPLDHSVPDRRDIRFSRSHHRAKAHRRLEAADPGR